APNNAAPDNAAPNNVGPDNAARNNVASNNAAPNNAARDNVAPDGPAPDGDGDRSARYALLFTDADTPAAWLTAGEALSAVLLAAVTADLSVSPMSDVVEVPASRELLRTILAGIGHPLIALRVGVAEPVHALPPTPRRSAG